MVRKSGNYNKKRRVSHSRPAARKVVKQKRYVEEENFVSGETLEFLSLDDEMIEEYNRSAGKRARYEEDFERDEDYDEDEIEEDEEEYYGEDGIEEDEEEYYGEDEIDEDEDYEDVEFEEDDEDDGYYEDEEYEEREGIFTRIGDAIANMTSMDRILILFGCFIVMAAVATSSIYLKAKTSSKSVEAFAEVGNDIAEIGIIGESGLIAVADAESARMLYGDEMQEEEMETGTETEEENGSVSVAMKLTSIQADMKIKFVNKNTNKLIGSVPFEVEVKGDNGKNFNLKDEDKDGIIYQTGIAAGTYSIKVLPLTGELDKEYTIPSQAESLKVTDTITYKKVDVADEVKTEAEVNVAVEDTAKQDTVVESTLTDTVEWVESTKSGQDSDANYQEIQKADIVDPSTVSKAKSFIKLVNIPKLDKTEINLTKGETAVLQVIDSNNYTVEWSSSDSGIVTVESGTVTAQGVGNATVYAEVLEEGTETKTKLECSVNVVESNPNEETSTPTDPTNPPKPTEPTEPNDAKKLEALSPTISSSSLSMKKGDTTSLSIEVQSSEYSYSVDWNSNNDSVASVSGGSVTAKGVGSATISAVIKVGGASSTLNCNVTVADNTPVYTIQSISGSSTVAVGKTGSVQGVTNPTGGKIEWTSSNDKVVKVDSNGTMTGVSVGSAVITGKCGNATGTWNVTVIDAATAVTITGSGNIQVGKTGTVSGTTTPAGGKIVWSSDNEKVVKIDSNGVMTGIAAGTANIIGTCGNAKGTWKVTVVEHYTKLEISGSGSIQVGKTGTVKGTTTPAGGTITWTSDNEKIVKVDSNGTMTGIAAGTATITGTCGDAKGTWKVTVIGNAVNDTKTKLKDKNGRQIYIKDANGKFIEAVYADYYKDVKFYLQKTDAVFSYTGWQTIDGYTYFFDKNGNKVTGEQVIQGAKYSFGSDGRLSSGSGSMGIDVSKWNGSIDWNAVKNSGVSYVIIRCGYRGSSTGALIEDPKFASNIKGAKAAGLKVGVYFFSQAVNEVEAVEEASMAVGLAKSYGLDYPIFLDVESSGGRGDKIDAGTRTAVCKAFCETVRNSGCSAGIYANKTWFTSYINTGSLTGYKIWLAQYAAAPSYTATRYDMWQYSSKGTVAGINGNVDMNISYMH